MFNFLKKDDHVEQKGPSLNEAQPKATVVYSENWYVFILPW